MSRHVTVAWYGFSPRDDVLPADAPVAALIDESGEVQIVDRDVVRAAGEWAREAALLWVKSARDGGMNAVLGQDVDRYLLLARILELETMVYCEAAVVAEREACALVCARVWAEARQRLDPGWWAAQSCAEQIRARACK